MAQATQTLRLQKRRHDLRRTLIYHGIVVLVGFAMLYPIIWMVASSLKAPGEIWTNVNSLVPENLEFDNYRRGWQGFGRTNFTVFYKNSFIYSGVGTLFHVTTSAVIAYGFARIRFTGQKIWFGIMLLTIMLPVQILFIPQYIIFSKLGWTNTFLPLLLPRLGGDVFFTFMIIQFIRGIPIDLDEAAMIDGCGKAGVFFRIILPQLKPALITAAIFSFYWTWEDFLGPLIYLTKPENYTVSVALRAFSDPSAMTDWGALFAMLTLSIVPVFIVFVIFQRYLVEGIATTGLKG